MAIVRESDDDRLIAALRQGDEAAFVALLDRYHASLLRLALSYVSTRAVAEEVVQETWLGLLQSLGRFEGRSSLRTWLFRILVHRALARATRESHSVSFSDLARHDAASGPSVTPERFLPASHRWAGHWSAPLPHWEDLPDECVLTQELRACLEAALADLPPRQRVVVTLRDVEGWTAAEVCQVLELTEGNQRVLLHRARARLRRALEDYVVQE
jgi:RNA polymerase sigma-70 factor (ECF subfamily)